MSLCKNCKVKGCTRRQTYLGKREQYLPPSKTSWPQRLAFAAYWLITAVAVGLSLGILTGAIAS